MSMSAEPLKLALAPQISSDISARSVRLLLNMSASLHVPQFMLISFSSGCMVEWYFQDVFSNAGALVVITV